MKKSLIALAVAGAMTAPMIAQADATLYGKFEVRLTAQDSEDLNIESDDFRIGIKGDADLGIDGVKGLYGYEFEVNPSVGPTEYNASTSTLNTRKAFVGVTGDFGTVLAGQIANPAEAVPSKVCNQSEMTTACDMTPDFLGSTVAYVSPAMNGFTAYVGVVMDQDGTPSDADSDDDVWLIGANYVANGLDLSVAHWAADDKYDAAETEFTGISGAYTFGATTVALGYQENDTTTAQTDVASIKVSHKIDNLTLWANYHDVDDDINNEIDSQYGLGAVYKLGSQASLDVEWVDLEGVTAADDDDILSVGYTVKF
ncbi:porin [Neptuniibacter halophilus]|uniref:porin n=1 Tax=Neptuniibacter halophilus TaxID=651666 RepID=UPI0025731F4D|nr:porin [Neptuniibacter halophilus]